MLIFLENCGKIYIKLSILTILKSTVQGTSLVAQ